jgi:hypothetical protein
VTRALTPFLLTAVLALCACAPSAPPAPATGSEDGATGEVREARWNGLLVRPAGTPDNATLLFLRGGRKVHKERDDRAQSWGLFPPRDLDGDGVDDLHAWFWSGGAHCCITHFVYSGTMGAKPASPAPAWRLEQGDGDPIGFATVPDYPSPVLATPHPLMSPEPSPTRRCFPISSKSDRPVSASPTR